MFQQPSLIGAGIDAPNRFLPKLEQARSSGPVEKFEYSSIKSKKQLKEIRKVLLPEKKKFLFFKWGAKYAIQTHCVVCGTFHQWDISDPLRPGIPLTEVTKGKPIRGTYCQKHAAMWKQMEMLEQQILAEESGLEFRGYIPKPKMPQMFTGNTGPLTRLKREDIASLAALGWTIKPPKSETETSTEEVYRLLTEMKSNMERIDNLILVQNTKIGDE